MGTGLKGGLFHEFHFHARHGADGKSRQPGAYGRGSVGTHAVVLDCLDALFDGWLLGPLAL